MLASFFSKVFARWVGQHDEVVAAARALWAAASDELGAVHVERYRTDEDGPERIVLAGGVFVTDESANDFIGALIALLHAVQEEGDAE
ncbi:MAG: hypothetical protein EBR88_00140 [Betaproteobacteria bacterium]|nr:hypothetical protein [Betaproteobacteria bacterium]